MKSFFILIWRLKCRAGDVAAFARVRRKRNATRGVHLEVMDQLFVLHGRIPVSWGLMGLVRVLCHIVGVRASGMLSPVFYAITGLFPLPRPVLLDYVINRIITRLGYGEEM